MTVRLRTDGNPATDPRYQHGAYVSHGVHLYHVLAWEPTGVHTGKLWVTDCRVEADTFLSAAVAAKTVLVRAASKPQPA